MNRNQSRCKTVVKPSVWNSRTRRVSVRRSVLPNQGNTFSIYRYGFAVISFMTPAEP